MLQLLDSDSAAGEGELVARVQQGDRSAFDRVMAQHADAMLRIAYGYVKSRAEAEDIVQDVFFTVWQTRAAWQPHGSIGSYFAVAVRRRALNVLKHRRVETRYEERVTREAAHDVTLGSTPPSDLLSIEDDPDSAWRLLDRLPDRARMVLLLRYGQQLSFADVATAMGISAPAARQIAKRALDQLRAAYGI